MRKSLSDYRTVIAHIAADRGESQGRLAFLRAYGASVSWTDEIATFEGDTIHFVHACPARCPSLFESANVILGRCPEHDDDAGCRRQYERLHLANPGPMREHRCVSDAAKFWADWLATRSAKEDAGRMVREQIVAEHTSAEYRYIAAVCLRKAVETMGDGEPLRPFRTRMLRTARAHEAEAKAELDAAHKACEDAGIPVNSSPILPLL